MNVKYAGICGSDMHTISDGHAWLPYPIFPGHEGVGVVRETAAGVAGLEPGDRVYLNPVLHCGDCPRCAEGRTNLCANLKAVGSHVPGSMSDVLTVPAGALRHVPSGMRMRDAALLEPAATAIHAIRTSQLHTHDRADTLVIGGGAVGQLLCLALTARNARVRLVDPIPSKRSLSLAHGVHQAFASSTEAEVPMVAGCAQPPSVVFDCVGSPQTIEWATSQVDVGGSVVVVGAGRGSFRADIATLQDGEIRLAGSAMYVGEDFDDAEVLLSTCDVSALVTSIIPLASVAEAFHHKMAGADEIKVLLRAGPS